jgi:heme oxygenase
VTPQSGSAFFSGYAEHTGSHWKAFGRQLTAFARASGTDDEIVAGAHEAFQTLDHWLYPNHTDHPAGPDGQPPHDAASRH